MIHSVDASTECIRYDSRDNTIVISCGNANLTDVYNAINPGNPEIINKGSDPKVWLLNANIKVENNSNFYINSTDTSWLKLNSTFTGHMDKDPNHILARGNLIIDSVKITSWDTNKNDYLRSNDVPRSYIVINYGNGITNVTNSELAYLGYEHARGFGLTYYTGTGSIIKNNKIHDLWYGFYSDGFANGAYNITIEGNKFYNNILYGIDPHSGTHDMIIKNNTVYNNGRHGIICATDCYNIVIESNKVFDNSNEGIMLYDNISGSVIKNNIVYNNKGNAQIMLASAHNNSIHGNNISGGLKGIRVSDGSTHNIISNNTIIDAYKAGIHVFKNASDNLFTSNKLFNASIIAYDNTFR
jgi:mannuronan 5-epimerase